jgi:NAD(P)-dependent dehydrogenase (short-subunit alcohol dehydrogenase family)
VQNSNLGLADRVAIITGGSRGIGKAVAAMLASYGTHVVVNYVKDAESAADVVTIARAQGVKAVAIRADVSQVDEAERLLQETVEHFGRVDFLICNAGIWEEGSVESISEELWDRTLDVNLKGPGQFVVLLFR